MANITSIQPLIEKYKELYQFQKQIYPETTSEEKADLKNIIAQYRRAMSLGRTIEPDAAMRIQEQTFETTTSTLDKTLYAMDYLRNFIAKNVIVPAFGLQEELGKKETVSTSDILGAMGMEEGWARTGLGFIGDVATDPITYLLPYARVAKAGTVIATKAGQKILLPKGMMKLAELRGQVLMERGLTDDIIKASGKAKAISDDVTKEALGRLATLADLGHESITADMFYSRAGYFHVPMTKIYKKLFTYNIPERIIKEAGNLPIISDALEFVEPAIKRIAQPFTVAAFRAAGHFQEKVERVKNLAYSMAESNIDVLEQFTRIKKKGIGSVKFNFRESLFPTKEAAYQSTIEYEGLGLISGKEDWSIELWKDAYYGGKGLSNTDTMMAKAKFDDIAKKLNMPVEDVFKVFEGHKILGDKLSKLIEEAGGVNEYIKYFIPHISEVKFAYELRKGVSAGLSELTFDYRRKFKSVGEFEQFLQKLGFAEKMNLNPFQIWSVKLTAVRRAIADKKYLDALIEKGIVQKIDAPGIMNAKDVLKGMRSMGNYNENMLKQMIEKRDPYITKLATDYLEENGKPLAIKFGKGEKIDFRLIHEQGRWGELSFKTFDDLDYTYRKSPYRAESILRKEDFIQDEINGQIFKARRVDFLDLRDALKRNVVPKEPYLAMASQGWNYITQKFKYWATVGGGQAVFMARNLLSDMSRTFYDNTLRTLNLSLQKNAITILTGYDPIAMRKVDLAKKFYKNELGEIASGQDIANAFKKTGLQSFDLQRFDVKLFTNEISRQKGIGWPIRTYFNWLGKSNVYLENHSKMVNFIADWQKGLSFEKAAELTHEFLYNYKLLPKAVQASLGAFPFGRWSYLNTIGMVKRFVDSPGKQAALIRSMEGLEEFIPQALGSMGLTAKPLTEKERESLPTFYQEDVAIPLYRTASGATGLLTSFDLPISELNEMGLFQGWRGIAKTLGLRLHPVIKAGLELGINKELFMGGPLTGYTVDEKTGKKLYPYRPDMPLAGAPGIGPIIGALTGSEQFKSLAGEVRWKADPEMMKKFELFTSGILSRPISEINKFMTLPAGSTALRMMTGTKIYEKDLPEMQLQKFKEYAARLNELFSARRQKEKFMVRE